MFVNSNNISIKSFPGLNAQPKEELHQGHVRAVLVFAASVSFLFFITSHVFYFEDLTCIFIFDHFIHILFWGRHTYSNQFCFGVCCVCKFFCFQWRHTYFIFDIVTGILFWMTSYVFLCLRTSHIYFYFWWHQRFVYLWWCHTCVYFWSRLMWSLWDRGKVITLTECQQ